MSYTIGFRGCQHLGYQPTEMRLNKETTWNQRIVDGHYAHEATMKAMLAAGVDGIVDGGDLTHWAKPAPRDIEVANRVDDLRVAADVWAIGNSGNHCAGGGRDLSAMGVMHRPTLGIHAVYPDPTRGPGDGVGPFPGLYEIHTNESNPTLPAGLALHLVSHYGLARDLAEHGINIDPQPLPGHVNLFASHGTFQADERLYNCIDPHGEERPIPTEWAHRGWDAMILSHYHTMGAVPGFGDSDSGQVWYTGSSLRRGFSDDPGPRGWLNVAVHDTGRVTITPESIWQRPQVDLPAIDATGLTLHDLDDLITTNLTATSMDDSHSRALTGDGGTIVRQVVTGSTAMQRQGLTKLRGRFASLTQNAAWWRIHPVNNARPGRISGDRVERDLSTRITDFAGEMQNRADHISHTIGVPDVLKKPVTEQAIAWAHEVSPGSDHQDRDTTDRKSA